MSFKFRGKKGPQECRKAQTLESETVKTKYCKDFQETVLVLGLQAAYLHLSHPSNSEYENTIF